MAQQGQMLRLRSRAGETPLWAHRHRVGGRGSRLVQRVASRARKFLHRVHRRTCSRHCSPCRPLGIVRVEPALNLPVHPSWHLVAAGLADSEARINPFAGIRADRNRGPLHSQ